MNVETTVKNLSNTVAFVNVKEFKGRVTKIDIERATELAELLKCLERFDFNSIEIGIEDNCPLLVFLDKDRETAFAIAPRVED